MNGTELDEIAAGSWRDRARLTPGTACGCFYCKAVFLADAVTAWTDDRETALCPNCGVDSVLPGITDPVALDCLHTDRFGRWRFSADGWKPVLPPDL